MAIKLTKESGPAIDFTKHRDEHPQLVKRFDKMGIALSQLGMDGMRAQVALFLDHSGSMRQLYTKGVVQEIVERVLAFSFHVDVDGKIPVYAFDTYLHKPVTVSIDNYVDVVNRDIWQPQMGNTVMSAPIREAERLARDTDAPLFAVVISDGSPNREDVALTTQATCDFSEVPGFLKFIAVAPVDYLQKLDDLVSKDELQQKGERTWGFGKSKAVRLLDNTDAFFVEDVANVKDLDFARGMLEEWDTALAAQQRQGVVV